MERTFLPDGSSHRYVSEMREETELDKDLASSSVRKLAIPVNAVNISFVTGQRTTQSKMVHWILKNKLANDPRFY